MKIFKTILLFLLIIALVLWGSNFINLYRDYQSEIIMRNYVTNIDAPSKSVQFYPNMRYKNKIISYNLEDRCTLQKSYQIEEALRILEGKTILEFYKSLTDPEIRFFCSEIAPSAEEQHHFVAGEGGPSEVVDGQAYAIILSGKVSLYRTDKCSRPQIAIHEILHALGFDHNNNSKSILFPVTLCDQEIDDYIINEINSLYSVESISDLVVEEVIVNYKGRYLNFNITVGNFGLKDSISSTLFIVADGREKGDFDIGDLEIGSRKFLSVENMDVGYSVDGIEFVVESDEEELSKENNIAFVEF